MSSNRYFLLLVFLTISNSRKEKYWNGGHRGHFTLDLNSRPRNCEAVGLVLANAKKSQPHCWPVWPDWAIFLTLGYFLRPLATINLPKSLTFLGIFVKVSKSILFLVKSFLGNFYRHLAIFIWSHCCELKMYSVVRLIWFRLLVNRLHELHRCQMAEAVAAVAAPFELSMRDSVGIVVVATRKQCDQLLE